MDTIIAFMRAQNGREQMVFDWDSAARIIKEKGATSASAGLSGDWEWTGGEILRNGAPVPSDDTYTYLSSNHARPELEFTDASGEWHSVECWKPQSEVPDWGPSTYWPQSALSILNAE